MTSEENIPEWPHKPAPPEPKRLLPEWPLLSRGLALAGGAAGSWASAAWLIRRAPVAGGLAAVGMAGIGVLFAWAAAIHLTGGEKFDDHRWV